MSKKIKIVMCPAGKKPYLTEVDDELKALQKLVDGYIEVVGLYDNEHLGEKYLVVCNEEGLIHHLPYNCRVCDYPFVGNIFVVKENGEEFASVEPEFLDRFIKYYWKKGE